MPDFVRRWPGLFVVAGTATLPGDTLERLGFYPGPIFGIKRLFIFGQCSEDSLGIGQGGLRQVGDRCGNPCYHLGLIRCEVYAKATAAPGLMI